jgi:hypothetical protein
VPTPGVPLQAAEVRDDLRAQGIEVEIPDEFEEVGLLFDHDGLVAVLEEVAHPLVPPVERPGVAREERAHAAGQGARAGADEEMGMVREAGPGVDGESARLHERGQAGHEVGAVGIIPEDGGALDSPHHHVVEGLRRIEAGLAGHGTGERSTS